MNLFLSVIVPIYNAEKYLANCIESILNQSFRNLELILVNDGSTDSSRTICERYRKNDTRIKVIHKKNEGPILARLTGVMYAKGDYITFVDSDDWIKESMYENLISICLERKPDIVLSGLYRYFCDNFIEDDKISLESGFYAEKDILEKILPIMLWDLKKDKWTIAPSLCTKIFKRELILKQLQKVQNLKIHYGDDAVTLFPLITRVRNLYIDDNSYYYHRQRNTNEVPAYISDDYFIEKTYAVYQYLKTEFEQSPYIDIIRKQLELFFISAMKVKGNVYANYQMVRKEIFPYYLFDKNTRVILYGAGNLGKSYMKQNELYEFCKIVMWIDKRWELLKKEGLNVFSLDSISGAEYQYILIAVEHFALANEIKEELISFGIAKEKIVWNGGATLQFKDDEKI